MLASSDLSWIISIIAERGAMFAKFFISGERKLGREIGRNFLQAGVGLCSKLSAKVLSCMNGVACLKEEF